MLTRAVARDWPPPDLNGLRGAAKKAERNGDHGDPVLWFWQMEGRRWELDGRSFDVVKRAWSRLAAHEAERHAESEARYDRADAAWEREEERYQREQQAAHAAAQVEPLPAPIRIA